MLDPFLAPADVTPAAVAEAADRWGAEDIARGFALDEQQPVNAPLDWEAVDRFCRFWADSGYNDRWACTTSRARRAGLPPASPSVIHEVEHSSGNSLSPGLSGIRPKALDTGIAHCLSVDSNRITSSHVESTFGMGWSAGWT
ncbi:hypothetical protein AB0I60_02230 [Actinosynnema sp. NPDC050436]|uniref:hypothetical protein n=1 Tax=Actinosynnema sp. NPDC050436 TaxID=3155659 RepID=UPI0033D4BB7D